MKRVVARDEFSNNFRSFFSKLKANIVTNSMTLDFELPKSKTFSYSREVLINLSNLIDIEGEKELVFTK